MAEKMGTCKYCGATFTYQNGWGMGKAPTTCQKHRGQYGTLTKCAVEGCEETFVKVKGTHTANCEGHRNWFNGKPRGLPKPKPMGCCRTCGGEFVKENGMARYCCLEHNPWYAEPHELRELARRYSHRLDWPPKVLRQVM